MAYNAAAVIEVRVTGDDSNGGGFNTASGGTDYSQSDTPLISVTDAVTNGTTTVTSATAGFPADCVGNFVCISGGTASIVQRWYQIQSRTNSTTIVVDAAAGLTAGTGATLKLGGAVQSPGGNINSYLVAGNLLFLKYNTNPFLIISASSGVTGGRIAPVTGVVYCGYDTTRTIRNSDANRPTIRFDPSITGTSIASSTASSVFESIIFDGNSNTGSIGLSHRGSAWRCRFQNFTAGAALDGAATGITELAYCEITGCSGVIATNYYQGIGCVGWNNTVTPFGFVASARDCTAFDNPGATTDGYSNTRKLTNCVGRNNGRHGCNWSTANEQAAINCIMEANGGYGFSGNANGPSLLNCVMPSNTSGPSTSCREVGTITVSASPFVNGAGGDFRLNNTAGAGALLRGTGYPATFPGGVGAAYRDVGALQHQDAGGGSTAYVPIRVPPRTRVVERARVARRVFVIPGTSTTNYVPLRAPARQVRTPAPRLRPRVLLLPGPNTVVTNVLPIKSPPRQVRPATVRVRPRPTVIPGANTVTTVYIPTRPVPRVRVTTRVQPGRRAFPFGAVAPAAPTLIFKKQTVVR